MSFSVYSKDFTANMFTSVENQFITKYLPQADGDAVRAYLYGLYLCQCAEEFDADALSKLLKISSERLTEIFVFWEECDLVHVLSKKPLFVEYLPVNAAVGKPKPVRPEKYAEFNRELYKLQQKAGKEFGDYNMRRILRFMEETPMEQQAFLLTVEYCLKKDGENAAANQIVSHAINKATKLCKEYKYTYEQVEADLNDFNAHEREMSKIFALLGIYRKPRDEDYDFLNKWTAEWEMETGAVYACASALKKGTLFTLDAIVCELREKEIRTEKEAKEYLARREILSDAVFAVAKKLDLKVQNPRPYLDEYVEKWFDRGYETESLVRIAAFCRNLHYEFAEMDSLLDGLYQEGIVDETGVKAYCAERNEQFKLLQSIEKICGVVKKTQNALDMINSWHGWNFGDNMILEAAKRSANAASPLPYMNKLLSEWKREGAFSPSEIPEKPTAAVSAFKNEAAIALDKKSEREHHFAVLRQRAEARAEQAYAAAMRDETFRAADAEIKRGEIELAKAELYAPATLAAVKEKLNAARAARAEALARLRLAEADLLPQYTCKKCSDTGFLPDGTPCDCY